MYTNSRTELGGQPCMYVFQSAKFKLHQYQWRAFSPHLMLAKVTRYNNIMVGKALAVLLVDGDTMTVVLGIRARYML